MSIENQIAALTAAVIELTNVIKTKSGNVTAPAPVAQPIPLVQSVPVVQPSVTPMNPAPLQTAAVAMPAPPTFAPAPVSVAPAPVSVAPAPVSAAPAPVSAAPFTDGKGLIDYVMSAYKAMGAAKGAMIQNVLTGLGYQNINDVKPEHYGALFQGIEALKVS
jgi:hypothetical protein